MSEKEEVVFDADVYRRLEFLERRFNALVEETHDAAELYVVAESSDEVNLEIWRFIQWYGDASWTTEPVAV